MTNSATTTPLPRQSRIPAPRRPAPRSQQQTQRRDAARIGSTELRRTTASKAPRPNAADLASATPDSRDRYVDFIRLVAIVAVVTGHWLVGLLTVGGDAGLSKAVGAQLVTWIWQVMPLFFFVGGFSQATALRSLDRRGGSVAEFWRSRVVRLLPPVLVMVAVWAVIGAAAQALGLAAGPLNPGLNSVAVPLWFIGIYLAVILVAPYMYRLHQRYGIRVLPVMVAAAVTVDVVRLSLDLPVVGYLNYLFVWIAIHQVGFFYANGSLLRAGRKLAAALAVIGLVGSALLTVVSGLYPVAMVSMPTDPTSNTNPPTLALLTHATWLIGLSLLLRPAVNRWLRNRRVWTGVIVGNGLMMTIFCWHMTAMLLVAAVPTLSGFALPATGSAMWWGAVLPIWAVACTAVLVGFIALFRRFERVGGSTATAGAGRGARRLAFVGTAAVAIATFTLSQAGFDSLLTPAPEWILGAPMIGSISLAVLIAGVLFLRATARTKDVSKTKATADV